MSGVQPERFRILAVDDELDTLKLYKEILCPAGNFRESESKLADLEDKLFGKRSPSPSGASFDLVLCRQGDEAVEAVRAANREGRPFAVAFIDVRMPPGRDGVATAEQIRALDPYVNIVIVTAYSDVDPSEIAIRVPPVDKLLYVQKPSVPEEIRQFATALGAKWQAEAMVRKANAELEARVKERTAELVKVNEQLKREIAEHKRTEEALQKTHDELEHRVEQRTTELARINEQLKLELTERKRAEEAKAKLQAQLQQAQKMEAMGTLAGGIAHDFNNILFAILGFAEMTRDDMPEGSLARANLEEVITAAKRARDLVQQMLTFSRQVDQERKPLQIHLIVKEVLKLLRASLPTTIEIRQNIQSQSSTILADPTQIHQVMMNLCTNAYYAMRERGGVLEVSLSEIDVDLDAEALPQHLDMKPGPYVKLTVSDTGPGMEPAVLERIFDPYFTTKGLGEGTGMGLAVVHGIVKGHGGGITVHSKLGQGTTFHVYLPRFESAVAPEARTAEPIPKGKEHILFVDDEEQLVRMAHQALKRLGYEVTVRTSSVEALEAFRAQPDKFDIVITDQTMPNMTGIGLAKELLRIRPDIPIILCTGFSEAITPERAKAMGIREFIMKPIVTSDIAKSIRRVLDMN
ncbi:MAG: response regulator [Deltaproteobacteria bacterium]|nr:response regulator [Deltaproteobacteria bacterium]MBW2019262.1 response regulator [Deltaproteobacteria bacterium]MBW2074068.1 response regulator [Deltaproteobacteria bacterium]RLB82510.1 MAG: hypothetical protein DRH17_05705 [Deltaproteobacteria bacterium]